MKGIILAGGHGTGGRRDEIGEVHRFVRSGPVVEYVVTGVDQARLQVLFQIESTVVGSHSDAHVHLPVVSSPIVVAPRNSARSSWIGTASRGAKPLAPAVDP